MSGLALFGYRAAMTMLGPMVGLALARRAAKGKEDPDRLGERYGHASAPRPDGRLVWLHGASVGESRVVLVLHQALSRARPDLSFLITSGTRTSAAVIAARAPARALHQFVPVDRADAVKRFLAHWRPDLGVFAESEVWPNLILAAKARAIPLALVNARMSPNSLANWARHKTSARTLFSAFDAVFAADARTAAGLGAILGTAPPSPGNLKLAAPAPTIDPAAAAKLGLAIGDRPVWCAASTHPGEDELVLAAHATLRARQPGALLLLAPRHPERGAAIAALCQSAPQRSSGALPAPDHPVYVFDTMGELDLCYAQSPVALVCGSLLPTLRGHNPIEPAQAGSAILSGPHVDSFADIYKSFEALGAVRWTDNPKQIADAVSGLWADPAQHAAMTTAARTAVEAGQPALEVTVARLLELIDHA